MCDNLRVDEALPGRQCEIDNVRIFEGQIVPVHRHRGRRGGGGAETHRKGENHTERAATHRGGNTLILYEHF